MDVYRLCDRRFTGNNNIRTEIVMRTYSVCYFIDEIHNDCVMMMMIMKYTRQYRTCHLYVCM